MTWYLYVVRTVDQRLYAGVSTDVERRFADPDGDLKYSAEKP